MTTDKFGITELCPTSPNGREWFSTWDNGHARAWDDRQNDPDDSEFWTKDKGTGSWKTDGQGILKISGSGPRMYIIDISQIKNWHNVEITVYGMRLSDTGITFGGIQAYSRTNHYIDANLCDDRGYGGRFTYDGRVDFEKETAHHAGGYVQVATVNYWSRGMPKNVWIGYKYIVYDLADGNVKLELYIDKTDGLDGGNWIKVTDFIDNGNNFGVGFNSCKTGIDPALRLTNSDIRPGSETGKPNLSVYFRSDGVGNDGLWYKKGSIREINISTPVTKFNIFDVKQGISNIGVTVLKSDIGIFTKEQACTDTCLRLGQI